MTHVNLEIRTLDKIPANTCHPAFQLDQSPSSKSCFRDSRPTDVSHKRLCSECVV